MRRLLFGLMLLAGLPATGRAQPDFGGVHLKPDDFVYVTDPATRTEVSGFVRSLTAQRITVGDHEFDPVPGLKIERRGDTIADGAGIGFLIGGLSGVTLGAEACLHGSKAPCFFGGGLWGAGFGAFIDWRRRGRTTVFSAPSAGGPPSTGQSPRSAIEANSVGGPPDFTTLKIRAGDLVEVTDGTGASIRGPNPCFRPARATRAAGDPDRGSPS